MKIILDTSNIVYGGHYGSPEYAISGFPCGGIRKFMGILNAELRKGDAYICMDSGVSLKKELLPTYKAGRVPNYAVMAQLDLLREILDDCGIPYYHSEGLEADDFICSLVHFRAGMRCEERTDIYSDDRDIACCVSKYVNVKSVTTRGICIDYDLYPSIVVPKEIIPYNTILLYKMIYGDKSDNYPGVHIPGLRFTDFAQAFISAVEPVVASGQQPISVYMNLEAIKLVIDALPDSFSAESKKKLKAQAELVFPRLVDVTISGANELFSEYRDGVPWHRLEQKHMKLVYADSFDQQRFDSYCCLLGLNRCRPERYGERFAEHSEEFKCKLHLLAKDLSNGVLAVEKYRQRKSISTDGRPVEDMPLPL